MITPGLRQEYQFRREKLSLTDQSGYVGLGPLRMSLARELTKRRLYCGVIWKGFTSLMSARAKITLLDGSASVFSMNQTWGFEIGNSTADSWGNSSGPLGATSGWPDSTVEWFGFNSYLGGTDNRGGQNAIKINGCSYDLSLGSMAYSCTMFPFEFNGTADEMRFEWTYTASLIQTAESFVEVYIGCNSTEP